MARLIHNDSDISDLNISMRLLVQEALRRNYSVVYYEGSPSLQSGVVRAEKAGKELFFKSTATALTPIFGYFTAENKVLTHSLLSSNDISTPATMVISDGEPIEKVIPFLEEFKRVVVKPVSLNHGDGVTVGIENRDRLQKAIDFAIKAADKEGGSHDVIVQQQVEGNEYRFLVVEGKVVAVSGRRPPHVVGDGVSTIRQLLDIKNADPRRGEGHKAVLTRISVADVEHAHGPDFMERVLAKGEEVEVLKTTNLSKGGEAIDYTDVASKEMKQLAIDAAEYTHLGIAGVDIMTHDITDSSTDDSYIIEVNFAPGLRMHQFPSEGKPRDVAAIIFKALEKTARPTTRNKRLTSIGRSEHIFLPELGIKNLPARIDTGATVSAIWASSIEEKDETLTFTLFDKGSDYYTGKQITTSHYSKRAVASSMGHVEVRFQVEMLVKLKGRKIRAKMTLANRSTQTYPVLIGRNILRNKFIVDVAGGKTLNSVERERRSQLNKLTEGDD